MQSTREYERDQARQEDFDADQERIDRFADRAAISAHRPGIIEKLRNPPPSTTPSAAEIMADAAGLIEEIMGNLADLDEYILDMGDESSSDMVLVVRKWLATKLEGK